MALSKAAQAIKEFSRVYRVWGNIRVILGFIKELFRIHRVWGNIGVILGLYCPQKGRIKRRMKWKQGFRV